MAAFPWCATGGFTGDAGSGLLQYGMGWAADRARVPSVVYAHNLAPKTFSPAADAQSGAPFSGALREALGQAGIAAVGSGHQPFGDCPLVIAALAPQSPPTGGGGGGGPAIISGDTSYSNNTKWLLPRRAGGKASRVFGAGNTPASVEGGNGTRGDSVSEVLFYLRPASNATARSNGNGNGSGSASGLATGSTRFHGVLSNGAAYDYRLEGGAGRLVGREVALGDSNDSGDNAKKTSKWWTRAVLPKSYSKQGEEEELVVVTQAKGFSHVNSLAPASEVRRQLGLSLVK